MPITVYGNVPMPLLVKVSLPIYSQAVSRPLILFYPHLPCQSVSDQCLFHFVQLWSLYFLCSQLELLYLGLGPVYLILTYVKINAYKQ